MAKKPRRRQRHPLFDLPQARANYDRVCQLPRFSVHEAAALLCGCDPEVVTPESMRAYPEHKKSKDYRWIVKVLRRTYTEDELDFGIDRHKLVANAERQGIKVPKGLLTAVLKRCQAPVAPRSADSDVEHLKVENAWLKEQLAKPPAKLMNSLKTIAIAAASKGLGYRGTMNSPAPGLIATEAAGLGLEISQPVVSKHLRDIVEELEPKWPKAVDD